MNLLNRQERAGAGLAAGSVLLVGGSVAASSLLGSYPVLGGQAIRYLAAGLLLAAWARLRHTPLPRPAGREWAWLAGLAVIGLAGCSVLLIQATQVADPASVGVGHPGGLDQQHAARGQSDDGQCGQPRPFPASRAGQGRAP